jgi:hypothetical protein
MARILRSGDRVSRERKIYGIIAKGLENVKKTP